MVGYYNGADGFVARIVSLSLPQALPVSALRILFLAPTFFTLPSVYLVNMYRLSKVTPSIFELTVHIFWMA